MNSNTKYKYAKNSSDFIFFPSPSTLVDLFMLSKFEMFFKWLYNVLKLVVIALKARSQEAKH